MHFGYSEFHSLSIEKIFAVILFAVAIWLVLKPTWMNAIVLSLMLLFLSIVTQTLGGKYYSEWSITAQIARIFTPVLLILLIKNKFFAFTWLLKIVLAATFITHGLECINGNPYFKDYILGNFLFIKKPENADILLITIGTIDILASLFLFLTIRIGLYWMFFWGFATAIIRIVDVGWMNYPEFLIRTPHFILAWVMLIKAREMKISMLNSSQS